MGKLTIITGGTRSGKSSHAVELAGKQAKVVFIATCQPLDDEMKQRIDKHRADRPAEWITIEEPLDIAVAVKRAADSADTAILDCLTLYISNHLVKGNNEETILKDIEKLFITVRDSNLHLIAVTNEVGSGIVPDSKLGREFRDIAGRINQRMANQAEEVWLLTCGIPMKIKG